MLYRIQARASRAIPLHSVCVLYGVSWENCEGADNLTHEECTELMHSWIKDDRLFARESGYTGKPHNYRLVARQG